MHIHIKNGRVIDPAQHLNEICDVYVVDGIIAGISEAPAGFSAEQTLDASGHIVCPGLIDMSAHTREPGFSRKGSISTESTAAVAGGITTLVTPPNTKPIIDTTAVAELIIERSEDVAKARVLPMGALTSGLKGEHLSPMFALSESGCIAFTNMRAPITSSLILTRCLEYAATHDLLVVFQPQDAALAAGGHMHEDTTCTRLGLNGIPETAETIEVSRCLLLAEQTGVRAHFGQLSCEKSVRMVMEARQRGLNVSVDVAIHHLLLIDEHVDGFDSNFHLIPPLRSQLDRAGLRQALLAGGIQALCSDHQPHNAAAKEAPFAATEPGMSGLETLLPLSLMLVEQGLLDMDQVIEKLTSAPASILGLEQGTLKLGSDADICIFDPSATWTLTPETSFSKGKNTPFMNSELKGRVSYTLVAGSIVYRAQ